MCGEIDDIDDHESGNEYGKCDEECTNDESIDDN